MPFHNEEDHLGLAIESILAQTYTDFELLAIDDGSTDGSVDLISAYSDPRIRIIRLQHGGLVRALNIGISEARGHLLARMDADDVAHPQRFERQKAVFENNPDIVLVGSAFNIISETGEVLSTVHPPLADSQLRRRLLVRNPFAHGSLMMRNLPDVRYSPHYELAEDYDLILQVASCGRLCALPDILYSWRARSTSYSAVRVKEQKEVRKQLLDNLWSTSWLDSAISSLDSAYIDTCPPSYSTDTELLTLFLLGFAAARRHRFDALSPVVRALLGASVVTWMHLLLHVKDPLRRWLRQRFLGACGPDRKRSPL